MKRAAILFATLLALSLTACGPSEEGPVRAASPSSGVEEASSPAAPEPADGESASAQSGTAPAPEDGGSLPPAPPVEAAPLAWWQRGLAPEALVVSAAGGLPVSCDDPYSYYYLYDDTKKLSYGSCGGVMALDEDADYGTAGLLLRSAVETDELGPRILEHLFFEVVALDDTKYTLTFYEHGVELTQSLPGEGKGASVKLALEEADYGEIQRRMAALLAKRGDNGGAAWLSMMRRSRITGITVTSSDSAASRTYGGFDDYLYEDVNDNRLSNARTTELRELPGAARVDISFNNGLRYEVYVNEDNLLVYASDIDSALLYDTGSSFHMEEMNSYARGEQNPRTGKPVIYLYPQEETDCLVRVDYPRFTYTYPAYEDGWRVTAYPGGRLVNRSDGSEHYYLFWEGDVRVAWDYSQGFVVKGSETEAFLREKLAYMGLTPREYNDFITYWVPRMQDAPYNLITFAGEQYEQLAPLSVSPAPDSVLRIHMVFRALKEPIDIPEQQLSSFERKGFTVVEWGGTNDN